VSDWGLRPLTDRQLHYAALDAAVQLRLYDAMASRTALPGVAELHLHQDWHAGKRARERPEPDSPREGVAGFADMARPGELPAQRLPSSQLSSGDAVTFAPAAVPHRPTSRGPGTLPAVAVAPARVVCGWRIASSHGRALRGKPVGLANRSRPRCCQHARSIRTRGSGVTAWPTPRHVCSASRLCCSAPSQSGLHLNRVAVFAQKARMYVPRVRLGGRILW
jgi:hypothetical protein